MKRLLLFAWICLLPCHLLADETPTGFRVIAEKSEDGVTLIMKSDYCVEYTVTLEATLKNMTSSRPLPFTVDAAGRSSFMP